MTPAQITCLIKGMENATITNLIPVEPRERDDDGSKWLVIRVPNGWDDVKKLTKKILEYKGETYRFMSWNSDTLVCNFKQSNDCAKIRK